MIYSFHMFRYVKFLLVFLLYPFSEINGQTPVLKTILGHSGTVNSITISPSGKYFVSGSDDKTVKLWDTKTGMEIRTLSGHKNVVTSVSFSPKGNYIVSGSWDKTIILWDTKTGKKIQTMKGHYDNVSSVSFSPDGNFIVSGSYDNTIKNQ